MKTLLAGISLALLTACQSTPKLDEDAPYVRYANVVDIHEFTEVERKQARANMPRDSNVGVGLGLGIGTGGGGFGGLSVGIGNALGGGRENRNQPPNIAEGANRITVQLVGSTERIEVMSYGHHKPGDCVKVLAAHPTKIPRFLELKPGERCE